MTAPPFPGQGWHKSDEGAGNGNVGIKEDLGGSHSLPLPDRS